MLSGFFLMRFIIPNFRALKKEEFNLEGRFKFVHNRLVTHTESVAFFGGDEVEKEIANNRLKQLENHIEGTYWKTLRFNIFNNFSIKQMPDIVAFYLRMQYALMYQNDASVMKDGGMDLSQNGEYIQQTVMRSFKSFGDAFDLQETIAQFYGVLDNVTDLLYVLEDLTNENNLEEKKINKGKVIASDDDTITFNNVDIVAPGAICVAKDLSFNVKKGESLVVSGPNASGKSSLFRTLGGLWPIPKGTISRPADPKTNIVNPEHVFLVPQKPYSVTGTLADQITYPEVIPKDKRTDDDEKKMLDLLRLVRIPYLVEPQIDPLSNKEVDPIWTFDSIATWEDVLSLGEQQRLGMARLFYHHPLFAILDECTSAISIDIEKQLYEQAKDLGITSITISQRLALEEFHTHELKLGDANGEKGWDHRLIEKN